MRLRIDWENLGVLLRRDDPVSSPRDWRRDIELLPLRDLPRLELPVFEGVQAFGGRVSLVARDWEAARLLMGRISAADNVRQGRSRRMVLVRARVFDVLDGKLSPFVQLGVGQWRVDPDMPVVPHEVLAAGQAGGGLELVLSRRTSIALEVDCTVLDPERSDPGSRLALDTSTSRSSGSWIHPTAFWGTFLAARATF
jgi:hypothetical protein